MSAPCRIDWAAFDLEDPQDGPCAAAADRVAVQACPAGHVHASMSCEAHVRTLASFQPLEDYGCGACCQAGRSPGTAPVLVVMLRPADSGPPEADSPEYASAGETAGQARERVLLGHALGPCNCPRCGGRGCHACPECNDYAFAAEEATWD